MRSLTVDERIAKLYALLDDLQCERHYCRHELDEVQYNAPYYEVVSDRYRAARRAVSAVEVLLATYVLKRR